MTPAVRSYNHWWILCGPEDQCSETRHLWFPFILYDIYSTVCVGQMVTHDWHTVQLYSTALYAHRSQVSTVTSLCNWSCFCCFWNVIWKNLLAPIEFSCMPSCFFTAQMDWGTNYCFWGIENEGASKLPVKLKFFSLSVFWSLCHVHCYSLSFSVVYFSYVAHNHLSSKAWSEA